MSVTKKPAKKVEAEVENEVVDVTSTNKVKDITKDSVRDITGGAKFDKNSTFKVLRSFSTTLGENGLVEANAGELIKLTNLDTTLIEALVAQGYIEAK